MLRSASMPSGCSVVQYDVCCDHASYGLYGLQEVEDIATEIHGGGGDSKALASRRVDTVKRVH